MTRYYLQTKKTTLSYSISDSETAIRLSALQKLDGTSVSAADIGDYMTGTFDPGSSKEEIFSIASSGVTVNADGTIDITGVVRGLREGGTAGYSTGGYSCEHGAGAVVVISNNPQLYDQMANKSNANTFTEQNIFNGYAPQTNVDPVNPNDMTRLSYVQALVLGTLTTIDVVVPGTAGETIVDGNLIYLNTDNKWYKTDADTASTVNNVLLGIAKGSGTTNNQITNGILLQGTDNAQSGLTGGEIQYASNTAGAISNTPGTIEVTVGIAKSTTELYFSPRFNQQITEDQQDALAGTSGNPSASNKFVTDADTSTTPVANKVVRYNATAVLPVTSIYSTLIAAESITAKMPVCAYYYQADGGVTYDSKTYNNSSVSSAGGTQTFSLTVGNNTNRIVVVYVNVGAASGTVPTPTVTYAGVSMSAVRTETVASSQKLFSFTLLAPTTGANNVVVTLGASAQTNYVSTAAISYYNVSGVESSAGSITSTVAYGVPAAGVLLSSGKGQNTGSSSVNNYNNTQFGTTNSFAVISSADSGISFSSSSVTVTYGGSDPMTVIGLTPVTAPSYGYVVKASAANTANACNLNKYTSFLGFADTTVTVGQNVDVFTDGIVSGLSGLVPLANPSYYIADTAGTISATAGTNSKKIGTAITTTTLLIKHDN